MLLPSTAWLGIAYANAMIQLQVGLKQITMDKLSMDTRVCFPRRTSCLLTMTLECLYLLKLAAELLRRADAP